MLTYKIEGTGPVVVLIHGFPLNRSIWAPQVAALSREYQVIALDLPGHGETPPVTDISIQGMAEEILNLLSQLGIDRFAVAGHSMGGYVALAMHQLAPLRIAGLALISTQAGADTPEGRQGRYNLAEKVTQEGAQVVAAAMGPKLFGPDVAPGSELYQQVTQMMTATPAAGIRAALHAMAGRPDMQPSLVTTGCRTLVLTGTADQLIPPERSEVMALGLEHGMLVRVEGAGHMPTLERPAEVTRAMLDWLKLVF